MSLQENRPAEGQPNLTAESPSQQGEPWLHRFYAECGREITLSMNTLHTINTWAVSLIIGLLSALAIIRHFPNVISYALLILGTTLVLRFFIRSLLAYTNLERFNRLQSAALRVLRAESRTEADIQQFDEVLERLYYSWASPLEKRRLLWSNAKLAGFTYLFFALLLVTVWAAVTLHSAWQAQLLTVVAAAILIFEAYLFFNSPYFRYVPPRQPEEFGPRQAEPLRQAQPATLAHEAEPQAPIRQQRGSDRPLPQRLTSIWIEVHKWLPIVLYWSALITALSLVVALNWPDVKLALQDAWDGEPRITP